MKDLLKKSWTKNDNAKSVLKALYVLLLLFVSIAK